MAYTKYSLTPADNNAAPPNGAPEGMLPSAVNDTMRDMMSQIRDVGDGIRGGTYTMTAPVITGGSITGVALSGNTLTSPVITGGSINNTTVGATTRSTGAFTTLASNGATTFTAGTASTTTTTGTAVITGGLGVSGRINAANFDGIVGANTAAAGNFTTLGATGVSTFSAGTVSAPAITTTGDTNTGIFFPAADTIAFTEGGVESGRFTSTGALQLTNNLTFTGTGNRILGDFSNSTIANRVMFQTSTTNGATQVSVIPNGTSNTTTLQIYNSNDPANSSRGIFGTVGTTEIRLTSDVTGTGTYLPLAMYTGGSERLRIDTSGNVGIGTSSPAYKLQVFGTGNNTSLFKSTNATSTTPFANIITGFSSAGAGADTTLVLTDATLYNSYIGAGGGSMYFATNGTTERMRIDSAGNVGIGTSSIAGKFNVASGRSFFGANSETYSIGVGFTQARVNSGQVYYIGATDSATPDLVFSNSAGTERMRIDSSGAVLIGSTTGLYGERLRSTGSGFAAAASFTFSSSLGATSENLLFFGSAHGLSGALLANNNSVSLANASDYRLKTNINPLIDGLKQVLSLNPKEFEWLNSSDNIKTQGFIAHEVQEILPSAVFGEKDAINKDGTIKSQMMDATKFIPIIISAIQELKAELDSVKAELQTLKGK